MDKKDVIRKACEIIVEAERKQAHNLEGGILIIATNPSPPIVTITTCSRITEYPLEHKPFQPAKIGGYLLPGIIS